MRSAIVAVALVVLFFAASLGLGAANAGCAAWQKSPGAVVATIFGCAPSIAGTIQLAVHAGQAHQWVDTAANSLAAVQDIAGCIRQVQQLEQAAHGCASSEGPACASGAMPAEEQQRLDQLPDIGRAVRAARAYAGAAPKR